MLVKLLAPIQTVAFPLLLASALLLSNDDRSGSSLVADAWVKAPCLKNWSGPSANNDLDDCTDVDQLIHWLLTTWVPLLGLPAVLGIFTFLSFPFVIAGRCCCQCCGGHKQRPGGCCCGDSKYDDMSETAVQMSYSAKDVMCARFAPFFLILLAISFTPLTFVSSSRMVKGVDGVNEGIKGIAELPRTIVTSFCDGTRRPDGSLFVQPDTFDFAFTEVNKYYKITQEEKYQRYIKLARQVAEYLAYLSLLPVLLIVLTTVFALARVRVFVPYCLAIFFFLCSLIYGLAGTVFFTANMPFSIVCGEVYAQIDDTTPSIMRWYALPKCEKENFISPILNYVNNTQAKAARLACGGIQSICSNASQPPEGDRQFSCTWELGNNCTSVADVTAFAKTLSIKEASGLLCKGVSSKDCTLCACGANCTVESVRNLAATACGYVNDGERVYNSFVDNVVPWINCDKLLTTAVNVLVPLCGNLPQGLYLMGIACTFITVSMIPSLIVVFRGQKRWFKRPESNENYYSYGGTGGKGDGELQRYAGGDGHDTAAGVQDPLVMHGASGDAF